MAGLDRPCATNSATSSSLGDSRPEVASRRGCGDPARTAAAAGISTRTASCSGVSVSATIRLSRSPRPPPQHNGRQGFTAPYDAPQRTGGRWR